MRRQAAVERNEERQRSTMETEMMLRLISSSFPFPSPHPPPFVPSGGRRYAGRTKGGCGKVKGRDGKELEEMRLDQKAAFWRILSTCLSRLSSVPFPFVPSVVVRSGSLCSPSLSTPVSLTRVAHSVSRLSSFVSLPHSLHSWALRGERRGRVRETRNMNEERRATPSFISPLRVSFMPSISWLAVSLRFTSHSACRSLVRSILVHFVHRLFVSLHSPLILFTPFRGTRVRSGERWRDEVNET